MKRLVRAAVLAAALALLPAGASGAPGDGIAGTAHDFTMSGVGLCTFCHTPHKALSTALLWNHTLSINTFQWDVTSTTAGTNYPTFTGDTYKGPTAKCLSCHDGSVAVGDIAWFNGGTPLAPLDNMQHVPPDPYNIGFGGNMAGNHPVAMPYPYTGAASTYNGVTTGVGFVAGEWQGDPRTLNIRLFSDDGLGNISATPVVAQAGIECSSCHDPHNKASVADYFLRGALTGSSTDYICLKCHVK